MLPCEQTLSQSASQTLQNALGLAWNYKPHTSTSGENISTCFFLLMVWRSKHAHKSPFKAITNMDCNMLAVKMW